MKFKDDLISEKVNETFLDKIVTHCLMIYIMNIQARKFKENI